MKRNPCRPQRAPALTWVSGPSLGRTTTGEVAPVASFPLRKANLSIFENSILRECSLNDSSDPRALPPGREKSGRVWRQSRQSAPRPCRTDLSLPVRDDCYAVTSGKLAVSGGRRGR